jgi:hypothetical protein
VATAHRIVAANMRRAAKMMWRNIRGASEAKCCG